MLRLAVRRWKRQVVAHPALRRRGDGLFAFAFEQTFKQPQVVGVVAGNGFDEGPKGKGAALGMGDWLGLVLWADPGEQTEVPGAERLEGGERCGEIIGGVAGGPDVLVEGLNGRQPRCAQTLTDRRQGLAEAEAEGELAVREVRGQFAQAPLPWTGGALDLFRGEAGQELAHAGGGGGEDLDGFAAFEVLRVEVLFHGFDGSTACCIGAALNWIW